MTQTSPPGSLFEHSWMYTPWRCFHKVKVFSDKIVCFVCFRKSYWRFFIYSDVKNSTLQMWPYPNLPPVILINTNLIIPTWWYFNTSYSFSGQIVFERCFSIYSTFILFLNSSTLLWIRCYSLLKEGVALLF